MSWSDHEHMLMVADMSSEVDEHCIALAEWAELEGLEGDNFGHAEPDQVQDSDKNRLQIRVTF